MPRSPRHAGGASTWLHRPGLIAGIAVVGLAAVGALATQVSPGTGSAAGRDHRVSSGALNDSVDEFGVSFVNRTQPGGTLWTAQWQKPRQFDGVDPQDPWFDSDHGSASYSAGGGQLRISGESPRMYVHDPDGRRQWRDVEITVYVTRVADSDIPFAGVTLVARSNHLSTDGSSGLCDTRGYGGRLRFDGQTDFEKETAHPQNEATGRRAFFPDGMPFGDWLGVKFLVFDTDEGVHLQLWLDRSDGADGGEWNMINETVDDGSLFGSAPCAPGIDPAMALTGQPDRIGSESGLPNRSVYFRSDGIAPDGMIYKWASVREITPERR